MSERITVMGGLVTLTVEPALRDDPSHQHTWSTFQNVVVRDEQLADARVCSGCGLALPL